MSGGFHLNDLLRSLRDKTVEVDAAEAVLANKEKALARAQTIRQSASADVYMLKREVARLVEAADALADDWRSWPWVKEDGFADKVPPRQATGERP